MKEYDYNKVLKIFAKVTGKNRKMEFETQSERTDIFTVIFSDDQEKNMRCSVILNKYNMDISIPIQDIDEKKYKKLLTDFEYEMEQAYLRNIELEISEDEKSHHIKIEF